MYRHSKSVRHAHAAFPSVCLSVQSRLEAKPNRPINRREKRDGRDSGGSGSLSSAVRSHRLRRRPSGPAQRRVYVVHCLICPPSDRRRSAINFFFAVCRGFRLPFQKRLPSFLPSFPVSPSTYPPVACLASARSHAAHKNGPFVVVMRRHLANNAGREGGKQAGGRAATHNV